MYIKSNVQDNDYAHSKHYGLFYFFFLNGAPKARGRMDWEQQTVGKHFDDDGGGLPSKQG